MKQPLSEQFRKMQKLAGIITEASDEAKKIHADLGLEVPEFKSREEEEHFWHMHNLEKQREKAMKKVEEAEATVGYDGDDWEVVSEYPNMLEAIEGVIEYLRSNPEMFMNWMIGDGLPALQQYGLSTPVIHLAGPGETPGSQPPMVVAMDELD